jgi:cytosine/adenosine deaminase-related metal-dependent hydrolase
MIYLRAAYILDEFGNILKNAALCIENGCITGIEKSLKNISKTEIKDLGPGILMPGVFNMHTHLELSCLKNKLDFSKGFKSWVIELIEKREKISDEKKVISALNEIDFLLKSGTTGVLDISSLGITKEIFQKSDLKGYHFYEELGLKEKFLNEKKEEKISFAAHAPHTTSPELIKKIKNITNKQKNLFSIHCSESDEELNFITKKSKEWGEFLNSRNIDFSNWPVPSNSSVEYLDKLNVLDEKTILVHVLDTKDEDFSIIKKRNSTICICPRSNKNLHNKLPDLKKMFDFNINIVLGTDSLASCESLDVFDEMKFILNNCKDISSKNILKAGCINPSKINGFEKICQTFKKGNMFNGLYINDVNKDIYESVIFSDKNKRIVL